VELVLALSAEFGRFGHRQLNRREARAAARRSRPSSSSSSAKVTMIAATARPVWGGGVDAFAQGPQ